MTNPAEPIGTAPHFLRIAVDLDDTLCKIPPDWPQDLPCPYSERIPYDYAVKIVNKWYDEGHYIMLYTARYMAMTGGCKEVSHQMVVPEAKVWAEKWGLKYHEIHGGKLSYDILFDDRAMQCYQDNLHRWSWEDVEEEVYEMAQKRKGAKSA